MHLVILIWPHDLGEPFLNSFYLLVLWFSANRETLVVNLTSHIPDLLVSWLPIKAHFLVNISKNTVFTFSLFWVWLAWVCPLKLLVSGKYQDVGPPRVNEVPAMPQGDPPLREWPTPALNVSSHLCHMAACILNPITHLLNVSYFSLPPSPKSSLKDGYPHSIRTRQGCFIVPGFKGMRNDTAYAFDVFLLICLWGKGYICWRQYF